MHSTNIDDYPIREYVGGMARELAEMARAEGYEALAAALDSVVQIAQEPDDVEKG